MATEKQIAANRLNAQKSTGPRTEEGKSRARFNATVHGLRAANLALPHEDTEEVQAFVDALIEAMAPRDAMEAELAAEVATLAWKLRRAERYEHAYLSRRMMGMQDQLAAESEDETGWNLEISGFDDDDAGRRRRRYLGGIRSSLNRARRELARWRAEHPHESESGSETEAIAEPVTAAAGPIREEVGSPQPTPGKQDRSGIGFVRPSQESDEIDFRVGRAPGKDAPPWGVASPPSPTTRREERADRAVVIGGRPGLG